MTDTPDPTPADGAGDPKPVPDDGASEEARDRRRVEKYVSRGMWTAAILTVLFNRPLRKTSGRAVLGAKLGAARGMGYIGEELTQIIGAGWTLIVIRWVGLTLMNLFLYWKYPVWGPLHVLANLFAFLVLEYFSNAWMLQRVITMVAAGLGAGFMKHLDKKSWPAFWASLFKALGESGNDVGYETYDIVRKIANEQHYWAVAVFICAFGMFGATLFAWATIPAAAIAAYILWKITTAGGNNKAGDGAHVITKVEYDTLRRERNAAGQIVWTVGKGRKFALPWFQSKLQLAMALLIAATVVGSWTAAFVYRNDTDHDGLSNYNEKKYRSDPFVADTDHDGKGDGEEIGDGTSPTIAFQNDPMEARITNIEVWGNTMDVSLRLRADSLRRVMRIREDSLRTAGTTMVPGTVDSTSASMAAARNYIETRPWYGFNKYLYRVLQASNNAWLLFAAIGVVLVAFVLMLRRTIGLPWLAFAIMGGAWSVWMQHWWPFVAVVLVLTLAIMGGHNRRRATA